MKAHERGRLLCTRASDTERTHIPARGEEVSNKLVREYL